MSFSQYGMQPGMGPQMASGFYNPALGTNHQIRGAFKGLCPEYRGFKEEIPDDHCVIQLSVGFEQNQLPWTGSINGQYCTILKGVPSIVPDVFALHLAETWETDYKQAALDRALEAHHVMRWPFHVIEPPKGEMGVQLTLMISGQVNPAAVSNYQQELRRRMQAPPVAVNPAPREPGQIATTHVMATEEPPEVYPQALPDPVTKPMQEPVADQRFTLKKFRV